MPLRDEHYINFDAGAGAGAGAGAERGQFLKKPGCSIPKKQLLAFPLTYLAQFSFIKVMNREQAIENMVVPEGGESHQTN